MAKTEDNSPFQMERVILLDTSLQGALLGLAARKDRSSPWRLETATHYESPQEAAAALPKMLDKLLAKDGLCLEDIRALALGVGPGSFTGIKIGLSFAYGLKRACPRLELHGLSALRSLVRKSEGLWLLPATQTAGYFAWNTSGHVQLGVVEGPEPGSKSESLEWKLLPRETDDDRVTRPTFSWPANARILGSWPRLEKHLSERGSPCSVELTGINALADTILKGMLEDLEESADDAHPQALYLRRSAPEEKLASQLSNPR